MVCDMNGFKMVNDRFGHLEGNRLLRVVADKLKESCREYDYVARMGGDEFVLILPGLTLEQVGPKIQRLGAITRDAGKEVFAIDSLSLSIGHASYPEDGTDAEQLLAEADRRMQSGQAAPEIDADRIPRLRLRSCLDRSAPWASARQPHGIRTGAAR